MDILTELLDILPKNIRDALHNTDLSGIEEIHLRSGGITTVTADGENRYLTDTGLSRFPSHGIIGGANEAEDTLTRLCGGSVYAYEKSRDEGCVTVHGIRAGLCGETAFSDGRTVLRRVTGIVLRIPRRVIGCERAVLDKLAAKGLDGGLLIASAPGGGKTTLLRELAVSLSRMPIRNNADAPPFYRVTVIDERGELYRPSWYTGCAAEVISGLPKSDALTRAVRVLNPQIIVCDELGTKEDVAALTRAHLGGVRVIASVHESSAKAVRRSPELCALFDAGVFTRAYLLSRQGKTFTGEWIDLPSGTAGS